MAASITINQPTGAGNGTLNTSRKDLWVSQLITFVAALASSYTWTLLSRPRGSTATLSATNTQSVDLMPDLPGTYQIQLEVGFDVRMFTFRVTKTSTGATANWGLYAPAYLEFIPDTNYPTVGGTNVKGVTDVFEDFVENTVAALDAISTDLNVQRAGSVFLDDPQAWADIGDPILIAANTTTQYELSVQASWPAHTAGGAIVAATQISTIELAVSRDGANVSTVTQDDGLSSVSLTRVEIRAVDAGTQGWKLQLRRATTAATTHIAASVTCHVTALTSQARMPGATPAFNQPEIIVSLLADVLDHETRIDALETLTTPITRSGTRPLYDAQAWVNLGATIDIAAETTAYYSVDIQVSWPAHTTPGAVAAASVLRTVHLAVTRDNANVSTVVQDDAGSEWDLGRILLKAVDAGVNGWRLQVNRDNPAAAEFYDADITCTVTLLTSKAWVAGGTASVVSSGSAGTEAPIASQGLLRTGSGAGRVTALQVETNTDADRKISFLLADATTEGDGRIEATNTVVGSQVAATNSLYTTPNFDGDELQVGVYESDLITHGQLGLYGSRIRALAPTTVIADISGNFATTITPAAACTVVVGADCASFAISQTQDASGAGASWSLKAQQGAAGFTGGSLTLGGGDGGTSGTNLGGNTDIHLGTQVSNETARHRLVASGGAVILQEYMTTAGLLLSRAGSGNAYDAGGLTTWDLVASNFDLRATALIQNFAGTAIYNFAPLTVVCEATLTYSKSTTCAAAFTETYSAGCTSVTIGQTQDASAAGAVMTIRAQRGATGAFDGGELVIGGGAPGTDGSAYGGNTRIKLGAVGPGLLTATLMFDVDAVGNFGSIGNYGGYFRFKNEVAGGGLNFVSGTAGILSYSPFHTFCSSAATFPLTVTNASATTFTFGADIASVAMGWTQDASAAGGTWTIRGQKGAATFDGGICQIAGGDGGSSTAANGRTILGAESHNPGTALAGNVTVYTGTAVSNVCARFTVETAPGTEIFQLYQSGAGVLALRCGPGSGVSNASTTHSLNIACTSMTVDAAGPCTLAAGGGQYLLFSASGNIYNSATEIHRYSAGLTFRRELIGAITMSSATTTNIVTFTTTSNMAYRLRVVTLAYNTTDSEMYTIVREAAFINIAGTVTQIGTTQPIETDFFHATQGGLDVVVDFSGTALRTRGVSPNTDTVKFRQIVEIWEVAA